MEMSLEEKRQAAREKAARLEAQYRVTSENAGRHLQELVRNARRILFGLAALIYLFCVAGGIMLCMAAEMQLTRPKRPQVYLAAQELIRDQLHLPPGTGFPFDPPQYRQLPGLQYEVMSFYQASKDPAQRTYVTIRLTYVGTRQWKVDKIETSASTPEKAP